MSSAPPGFFAQALRIAKKDLAIEWRSREVLATMTFLAVVVVLIFSFAFVIEGTRPPAPVVAGIVWVALVVLTVSSMIRRRSRRDAGVMRQTALISILGFSRQYGRFGLSMIMRTLCA